MNKPLVSICCLTYNQEKYIGDAIEGFLLQETSFPVEVIIHDDASTDTTGEVLKDYAKRNPGLFVILSQTENQYSKGINPFFRHIFPCVSGKYIAFCEGDDYWTDPLKLQKQADFLENNPDYGMICTDYNKYIQGRGIFKRNCFSSSKYRSEVKFDNYLLDMSSIGTATVMIRSDIVHKYLGEIAEDVRDSFVVGDTPLWLFTAAISGIAVLQDNTAVYRILDTSACHFKKPVEHYKFVLKGFEIADYFYEKYGRNNGLLLDGLKQKKLKASLFHGYRTMDWGLASGSYKELISFKSGFKKKMSARLMLAGSCNKLLNRMTGIILKSRNRNLTR